MARHKGKVERGVGYVKENALKGRSFGNLEQANDYLFSWERNVADTRIHGTTRQQVKKLFEEYERPALLPLPSERFPFFHEGQRNVHSDGHIEVDKSYYSVPPEYVGRAVWVRWDSRIVNVFNQKFEKIAVHVKKTPGQFSTSKEHISSKKISMVELGATWMVNKAEMIGEDAGKWAKTMLETRGIPGMRVIQGLIALAKKYGSEEIDKACKMALEQNAFRLRHIRVLIGKKPVIRDTELLTEHPIIRPMTEYGNVVKIAVSEGNEIVTVKPKEVVGNVGKYDNDSAAVKVVGTGINPGSAAPGSDSQSAESPGIPGTPATG